MTTEKNLSLPEMVRKYRGQWLAVRVTARDQAGQPVAGIVLARAPTRLEADEAVKGEQEVCLMYAGDVVPEGYGVLY
ncbi:MAG: hypothetical protein ACLF0G_12960 [Candidatus Brocadiia bacterium]